MSGIRSNVSLNDLNTFGVSAKAEAFVEIDNLDQLQELSETIASYSKRFILGGGSNLLFIGDFPGLVIYPKLTGIEIIQQDQNQVTLKVCASENWHDFVRYCLEHNYYGLENLALIPGTVGAAPVQNIGAYGVEVQSRVSLVECFDFERARAVHLSHSDCLFGYRDSLIKQAGQGRYLVTSVHFILNKKPSLVLDYKPLKDFFAGEQSVSARQVFDRICEIRAEKLPDPNKLHNAGSFFKNPVVSETVYQRCKKAYPDLVAFAVDSNRKPQYKIAAGWLIEKAGFKGKVFGKVGVHKHQALVLVNYSDSDGANLLALAERIMQTIKQQFGISLQPEVRILGNQTR